MDTAETRLPDDRPPRLLSAQEVAEYLGVPITTIYTWRHRSQGPPGLRVGRHLRYRRRDVEAWIERQLDNPTL